MTDFIEALSRQEMHPAAAVDDPRHPFTLDVHPALP
jgi:hypothetical protein